jgi:hypothetical protein
VGRKVRGDRRLPEPPPCERRVHLEPLQWLWLGLLLLIPLLAMLGVLGPRAATATVAAGGVELQVRYPSLLRHGMVHPFEVAVRSTLATPLPAVTLHLDRAFIDHFSEVDLTPQPAAVTAASYEIPLGDLRPNETRRVSGYVKGDAYGRRGGVVWATAPTDAASAAEVAARRVAVATFVFP